MGTVMPAFIASVLLVVTPALYVVYMHLT